jgi:hypothetical protein
MGRDEQRDQGEQEAPQRAARPANQAGDEQGGGAVGAVARGLRGQRLVSSSRSPGQASAMLSSVAPPRHAHCWGLRSTECSTLHKT